jgi:hypothetical protein
MKIVRNTCHTWLLANRPLQNATAFDENLFPILALSIQEELVRQND